MKTITEIKEYEMNQYKRALLCGTDKAWKRYWANVKRVVTNYNKTHAEQIDINALTA